LRRVDAAGTFWINDDCLLCLHGDSERQQDDGCKSCESTE
jgi:hypothetical protein